MKTKITNFSPRFDINQPLAKWLSGESRSKLIASRRIAGIAKLVVLAITLLATSLVAAHSVEHGNHQQAVKPLTKANPDTQKVENLVRDYSLTGDDNLLKQGWAQITPRLHAGKTSAEDLLNAAWLAQADHEFHRALGFTESVLTLQPNNAQAWLLKSSIHTVLNESEQALQACQQLSLSLSIVAASACAAQNTSSQAEKAAAYSKLRKLMAVELSAKLRPWVESVAADLAFSLGKTDEAEQLYRRSMADFPSVQVRAALSDLLLKNNRPEAVLAIIDDQQTSPALRIRRLMAEKNSGLEVAEKVSQVDLLFRQWADQGDYRHAREMTHFYLYLSPDQTLAERLATENYKHQREPEDLHLLQLAQARTQARNDCVLSMQNSEC